MAASLSSDGVGESGLLGDGVAGAVCLSEGRGRTLCVSAHLPGGMARDEWSIDQFELLTELYRGKTSLLHEAHDKHSDSRVAVKQYRKAQLSPLNRRQIEREIAIHVAQRHPHIITLHAAFETSDTVFLVQEFAAGGDLFEALKRRPDFQYDEPSAAGLLAELLEALAQLHGAGIAHRDIKPENILLGAGGVKLADFGLAINSRLERAVTRVGTLDYMSPEVLVCPDKKRPEENKDKATLAYTTQVDAWAVGCLAAELLTGSPPFEADSRSATYQLIMYRQPRLADWLSPLAKAFIAAALSKKPGERATAQQLLQHEWITSHCHAQQQATAAAGGAAEPAAAAAAAACGAAVLAATATTCEAAAPEAAAATCATAVPAAVAAPAAPAAAPELDEPQPDASGLPEPSAAVSPSTPTATTSSAAIATAASLPAAYSYPIESSSSSSSSSTAVSVLQPIPLPAFAAAAQPTSSSQAASQPVAPATADAHVAPDASVPCCQQSLPQQHKQQQRQQSQPPGLAACGNKAATGAHAAAATGGMGAADAAAASKRLSPASGSPSLHRKFFRPQDKHRRSSYNNSTNWDEFIETVSRSGSFTAAGCVDDPESAAQQQHEQQQVPVSRSSLLQAVAAEPAGSAGQQLQVGSLMLGSALKGHGSSLKGHGSRNLSVSGSASSHHDTLQGLMDAEPAVVSAVMEKRASGALHQLMPSTLEDLISPSWTPLSTLSHLGLARAAGPTGSGTAGCSEGSVAAVSAGPPAAADAWSGGNANFEDCISLSAGLSQLSFSLKRSGGSVPCCLSILSAPPGAAAAAGSTPSPPSSPSQGGGSSRSSMAPVAVVDQGGSGQQRRRRAVSLGPAAQAALLQQQQQRCNQQAGPDVLRQRSGTLQASCSSSSAPAAHYHVAQQPGTECSCSGGAETPRSGRRVLWADIPDADAGDSGAAAACGSSSPRDGNSTAGSSRSYYAPPSGVLSSNLLPSPRCVSGMEAAAACAAAANLARSRPLSGTARTVAASRSAADLPLLPLTTPPAASSDAVEHAHDCDSGFVFDAARAGSFTAAARPLAPTKPVSSAAAGALGLAGGVCGRSKSLTGVPGHWGL